MGAGAEVVVQGGRLMLKPLTPIPAMRRGFRLYPDDPDDPWVFRIYFPEFGMNFRVVFDGGPTDGTATRLLLDVMSFERRPDFRNPRPWVTGGLAVGTAALAIRGALQHRGSADDLIGAVKLESAGREPGWWPQPGCVESSRALAAKTSMSG